MKRSKVDGKVLSEKLVFKTKRDKDSNILKYKARQVIQGFRQQYNKDFDQTYAGVYKSTLQKIILVFVALYDLEIEQINTIAAFLNGDIDGKVYIELLYSQIVDRVLINRKEQVY